MDLSLPYTIALLIVGAAAAILCGWMGSRPMNPDKGPRMIPWRFFMLLSVTFAMLMLVHLLNSLGIHTGDRNRY